MITLTAHNRNPKESLSFIRSNNMMPAVVYGAKNEATMITVESAAFAKVWKEAGESTALVIDLEGKKINALIHDMQYDPIKKIALHADFLAIDTNKPVHVTVALEFVGVSEAAKQGLGSLVKVLHEVEIEALPKDLPHTIEVDISKLVTLEDQILTGDLKLPSGVTLITKDDEVVALVAEQKEEVEEAPTDISSIEVEKKGKQEEETA